MKKLFNLTTSEADLERFSSRADFKTLLQGFDGVELMHFEEDTREILKKEDVVGFHMGFFPTWVDFWKGEKDALLKNFGSEETYTCYYGGPSKDALLSFFQKNLQVAKEYGAEYLVFHVSESTIEESFTWNYKYTDEQAIDETASLINELFAGEDGSMMLLFENLWQPGLTFTNPAMTERLLEKVSYKNTGFMLDTGHLLHTNLEIKTEEEGIAYIRKMMEEHASLKDKIYGVHLNQSITGEYSKQMMQHPPKMKPTFEERIGQMFLHAFQVDRHQPFTGEGIKELIDFISPKYLTYEFISNNLEEHKSLLLQQERALGY